MLKSTPLYWLPSLLLGLGVVVIASVPFLYWFIHGDYERYLWIINGPYPFSQFGSGPFQLWVGLLLLLAAAVLIAAALLLGRQNLK